MRACRAPCSRACARAGTTACWKPATWPGAICWNWWRGPVPDGRCTVCCGCCMSTGSTMPRWRKWPRWRRWPRAGASWRGSGWNGAKSKRWSGACPASDWLRARAPQPWRKRLPVPSRVIRSHTCCFSSSLKNTQLLTSAAVRPQPWHTSSNKVEQMPMQGLSGRSESVESVVPRSGAGRSGADSEGDGMVAGRWSVKRPPIISGAQVRLVQGRAAGPGLPRRSLSGKAAAVTLPQTSSLEPSPESSHAPDHRRRAPFPGPPPRRRRPAHARHGR
ncbi:hypothetical protein CBM2609_A100053 [Cupriavidus taiwanensis]|nr:hypothetical protein CBM2609_A100053 [Cupriavidus taiwanensis]SOZ41642.1 hypothetical protein CBM2610_A100051 [Cupriavidus taiwanensis]